MGVGFPPLRAARRLLLWPLIFILIFLFLTRRSPQPQPAREPSALVQKYIDQRASSGGAWHIPSSWLKKANQKGDDDLSPPPQNILAAARLALKLATQVGAFADHSNIPLIAHQTWMNLNSSTWSDVVRDSVDGWLRAATSEREFAYFLWDDDGLDDLIRTYEPALWPLFQKLPYPVTKADVFRVVVTRWFGGVYADVDVKLIQHPADWVHGGDLTPWDDPFTHVTHDPASVAAPERKLPDVVPDAYAAAISPLLAKYRGGVGTIYGIECDTLPNTDDYWRMGYEFPVQITNWAFAISPHHPTASAYLARLKTEIEGNVTRLREIDPLDLTGPPALTHAVKLFSENYTEGLQWNSLTSIYEPPGGRGKICAGDVLVLPITGFSPGRGTWYGNMGSMPETDPNARLKHVAQGSWKKTTFMVQAGKLCRTLFGLCRDWKKIP